MTILTRLDGTPFRRPAREDYPDTMSFVRAFYAYQDALRAEATQAFNEALLPALRRGKGTP